MLPTALGVSSVTVAQVATSLIGFVLFYTALAIVDAILMLRYARTRSGWSGHVARCIGGIVARATRACGALRSSACPTTKRLRVIWWLLLGVLLIGFAIMDGFDLGVAALVRVLGHDDDERRALLETVEPVWEGNQVWIILGGGAIFAAWPLLYAASFSGFYFAILLVLVGFILRPVGFGFRNKIADPRWRTGWDWALTVSGVVPSLIFGVAFGNLFLGVPFRYDDTLRMTYEGGLIGLLRPFPLLAGVVSLTMLLMHGAAYASMKADEIIAARAARLLAWFAGAFAASYLLAGIWLAFGISGYAIQSARRVRRAVESAAQGSGGQQQAGWPMGRSAHGHALPRRSR